MSSSEADDFVPKLGPPGTSPPALSGETLRDGARRQRGMPSSFIIFDSREANDRPRSSRLFSYGRLVALAVCLFGVAWAAGSYIPAGYVPLARAPVSALSPKQNSERDQFLRANEKMAEDIRSLKDSVEALRSSQGQGGKNSVVLDNLKTRLGVVKSETAALIAELSGKVERISHESEGKLAQIIDRLDRIEHSSAAPANTPITASAGRKQSARGDAFDPAEHPDAPGAPRPLAASSAAAANAASGRGLHMESSTESRNPQLITNWVVRDVYDGIALVESPHGSIEVIPGETIPGAGTVKAIERRGAGWIVITSRGVVDSARDAF